MAYAVKTDIQEILTTTIYGGTYPTGDAEIEFAETKVNGVLAGHYNLPFDDVTLYTSVPDQIKWITAHLAAFRVWNARIVLEGQDDDTAAQQWWDLAMAWLERIKAGDESLTYTDGTLAAALGSGSSTPRYYPSGTRDKADSDKNLPYFKRAQALEW